MRQNVMRSSFQRSNESMSLEHPQLHLYVFFYVICMIGRYVDITFQKKKSITNMPFLGNAKRSETKIPKRRQGSGGASSQRLSRWQSNLGTSAAAHGKIGWWIPEGGWWECIYTYIYIYTYTCIYIYICVLDLPPTPWQLGFFRGRGVD